MNLLGCADIRAIATIDRVPKAIPVHHEPAAILAMGDYYNVCVKQYSVIKYPTSALRQTVWKS